MSNRCGGKLAARIMSSVLVTLTALASASAWMPASPAAPVLAMAAGASAPVTKPAVASAPVLAMAAGASAPVTKPAVASAPVLAKATFAGGCFWCIETAFEGLPGVTTVISGYTDGAKRAPTYDEVSAGRTGHAESVQITYDPGRIGYPQLLEIFWANIDPTQADGQFCDHGTQYRSAIFYHDPTQRRLAEASKRKLETTPQRFKGAIVTSIVAATRFWPAEEYHQDFYRKDPVRYQSYRTGCGRDRRLTELWGKPGRHGHAP